VERKDWDAPKGFEAALTGEQKSALSNINFAQHPAGAVVLRLSELTARSSNVAIAMVC